MAEYIERDKVVESIKELMSSMPAKDNYAKGCDAAIGRVLIAVRQVSAANVQPVKRGKWLHIGNNVYQCQLCGYKVKLDYDYNPIVPNFCGRCGADMREPEPIKG